MERYKCKTCGEQLVEKKGEYYICKYCGHRWMIEENAKRSMALENAWESLRLADFDRAEEFFDEAIEENKANHEAYWGKALAAANITYVNDLSENKKVPTCHNISEQPFSEGNFVKNAIKLAPKEVAIMYRQQAEYIDKVRAEWLEKADKEPDYDVFISYKDSDKENNIDRTDDSYACTEIYTELIQKGYKVFYSRISLKDKISEQYEPYIYNAIKTAKVMIVYAEKAEYITSPWVKNEWSRFRKRIELGEKDPRSLVLVYKNINLSDIPTTFRSRQCLNKEDITFLQSLITHIEKIIKSEKKPEKLSPIDIGTNVIKMHSVGQGTELSLDVKQTLTLVNRYIANCRFDLAKGLLDGLLASEPNNGDFLLSKLIMDKQLTDEQSLLKDFKNLSEKDCASLKKVIMYSQKDTAEDIINQLYKYACDEKADGICKKIYEFVLPFNISSRKRKISSAFKDCIEKNKYDSFTFLLGAMSADESNQYVDYMVRYISANASKNELCYDMGEKLWRTKEFNYYLATLSKAKQDDIFELMNKQKYIHKRQQEEQLQRKHKHRQEVLKTMFFVSIGILFVASVVFFVLSTYQFSIMKNQSALKIGKIYKYTSLACGGVMFVFSLIFAFILNPKKNVRIILLILTVVVLVHSIIFIGYLTIQNVYCHTDNAVYFEYKNQYKLKRISNESDVIILSEINGKEVKWGSKYCTSNTRSITFVGGEWSLSKIDFLNAEMLKRITVDGANIVVKKQTFIKCPNLQEICINNGVLSVSISKEKVVQEDDSWDIFNNESVCVYLNNGSLINLTDDLKLLDVYGKSSVNINLRMPASAVKWGIDDSSRVCYFSVQKIVFHEDVDFSESIFKRNTTKYYIDFFDSEPIDRYYPIGNNVYLPKNINKLPEYFFGDEMEDEVERVNVYFEGSVEEWDRIVVGENGNENFFSGKVDVIYNYTAED